MIETFAIAGYCRISVDEEMDRENTSIENQKAIIEDYVAKNFPGSSLTFFEDRDRSGYTFEQREGYQQMRPLLMAHQYDILIVKDFSRFARRNSRGLVELEDLRDQGVRIISIGDSIDYPTYDDWTAIQFRFLINEMPVTDTSKKVKSVIKRRQNDGKWICAVPYGYVITNSKTMAFEVDEPAAEVVRKIFELYNDGWGYKKIANHLTELKIPTPRMVERRRKEERGEESKLKAKQEWSIVTVQGILENDFYIGTLRQGKYTRKKINGADMKKNESDHIIFENHHPPIVDYRVFAKAQEQRKHRTNTNYRGIKKYENAYSGFLVCGDCGAPMFSMSRSDLKPAYICGSYHRRGRKGCTSHHTRVDLLDDLLKRYIRMVKENSADMLEQLNAAIQNESTAVKHNEETSAILQRQLDDAYEELKATKRQRIRDVMKHPDKEALLEQTYDEMEAELEDKITGLKNQLELTANKRNTIIQVNRVARTAMEIFDEILAKDKLDKTDLELIIEKITVYENRIEIKLKADIDHLLQCGVTEEASNFKQGIVNNATKVTQSSVKHADKVYDVSVVSDGDPLEIFTDAEGGVIFKKYSAVGEMSAFAAQYADVLSKIANRPALVCDCDHVIAVAGASRKEYMERRVSQDLEETMHARNTYVRDQNSPPLQPVEGINRAASVVYPIIASSDVMGAVVLLAGDSTEQPDASDIKLTQAAASFLARQIEN